MSSTTSTRTSSPPSPPSSWSGKSKTRPRQHLRQQQHQSIPPNMPTRMPPIRDRLVMDMAIPSHRRRPPSKPHRPDRSRDFQVPPSASWTTMPCRPFSRLCNKIRHRQGIPQRPPSAPLWTLDTRPNRWTSTLFSATSEAPLRIKRRPCPPMALRRITHPRRCTRSMEATPFHRRAGQPGTTRRSTCSPSWNSSIGPVTRRRSQSRWRESW